MVGGMTVTDRAAVLLIPYFALDHLCAQFVDAQHLNGKSHKRFFGYLLCCAFRFALGLECGAIPEMLASVSNTLIGVAANTAANEF